MGGDRADVPGGVPGRFPGFEVLDSVNQWDAVTAGVVLSRLGPPPPLRFFTPREEAVGGLLFDLLLDQRGVDEPGDEPRVPVLRMVDARLAEAQTDGWRYADMPEDGEAFRRGFAALDDEARARYGSGFAELDRYDATDLVQYVQDRTGDWRGMAAGHVWSLWTRYACTAFYADPRAWNEMGFPGPAYPRGYANLGVGGLEHWERRDTAPPEDSPVGSGAAIERARRRHAAARTRELRAADPAGTAHGVGAALARDEPGAGMRDEPASRGES